MTPREPVPDDKLAALGEPFTSYARALLAADDARQRLHEAQVAGDREAAALAELDRERAVEAVYKIRHHEAARLLFAVRAAVELFPGALQTHLAGRGRDRE